MHWKKLVDSSLHIDFGLIVTNLPCRDVEALLIPDGCCVLIHHVLGCQDQTLDESAYLLKRELFLKCSLLHFYIFSCHEPMELLLFTKCGVYLWLLTSTFCTTCVL